MTTTVKTNKKHLLKCWLWKGLWGVSALCLILAWATVITQSPLFIFAPDLYLWTALVLGVLAISIKQDCANCSVCRVGN